MPDRIENMPKLERHQLSFGTVRGLAGSPGDEHERKSWRAWAGQKFRSKQRGNDDVRITGTNQRLSGWAPRR